MYLVKINLHRREKTDRPPRIRSRAGSCGAWGGGAASRDLDAKLCEGQGPLQIFEVMEELTGGPDLETAVVKPADTDSSLENKTEAARHKVKFEVFGEEMLEKLVKLSGKSGRGYLP